MKVELLGFLAGASLRAAPPLGGKGEPISIRSSTRCRLKTAFRSPCALVFLSAALFVPSQVLQAATNELAAALQKGLFEEEANRNFSAAIEAYQAVAARFDQDRKLAATAIFRLGECSRKQGNYNDAKAQYERILREFSDQPALVSLSRENLAALGAASEVPAAPSLSNAQGEASANAAAAAEAERLNFETQLAQLKALPADKLAVAVQQEYPNPVLTALAQKLAETEQHRMELQQDYGPEYVEVKKANSLVEAIHKQIGDQVEAVLRGLEMKRDAAARTAKALQAQAATAASANQAAAQGGETFNEAEEVRRIQNMIRDSPDLLNAPEKNGLTPLQTAAAKGKLAIVKVLLDNGAAIDGLKRPDLTPLHYAAGNGHKAVVDLLLSRGARVDALTESGVTPLHLAVLKGYEVVAQKLIEAGAPFKARVGSDVSWDGEGLQYKLGAGETPLHVAAKAGFINLAQLLISKGADVNAVDGQGRTPSSYAAQLQDEALLKALLATHADPNAGSKVLPLHQAARDGDLAKLELLLSHGADPDAVAEINWLVQTGSTWRQNGSFTPLFLAVGNRHPDAVKVLLRFKADPNAPGPEGVPPVFEALSDAATLEALLEGGADPNERDSHAAFPLQQAIAAKNEEAVKLLLAHHAKVNQTSEDGTTPLHYAVESGSKRIVELLLENKADVNATNNDGTTPLHLAVQHRAKDIIELLLAKGADVNIANKWGQTPLTLAKAPGAPGLPSPPLAYQWNFGTPPGAPGTFSVGPSRNPNPVASPGEIAALLIAHGATEDIPNLNQIELRRPSANISAAVLSKGAGDYNRFTLLELLAVNYQIVNSPCSASRCADLGWPSLTDVIIREPAPRGKYWKKKKVDVLALCEAGDCSRDIPLAWGAVVEIEESDHPIAAGMQRLPAEVVTAIRKCLKREVQLSVKGQTTNLVLEQQFCLLQVLRDSRLLRASSDLSRVKVTRRQPGAGQTREMVLDCSNYGSNPDLWLRDGDVIEVPEKSPSQAAQGASLPMPPPQQASFQERLQAIVQNAGGTNWNPAPPPQPPILRNAPTVPGPNKYRERLDAIMQNAGVTNASAGPPFTNLALPPRGAPTRTLRMPPAVSLPDPGSSSTNH